ncbi:MAG: PQQ-like beta-propeller repeat protein [Pelotomaculum sp.]|nr:PQQ-like beta-propeller repeat protein [Pelotomaculum sp.]
MFRMIATVMTLFFLAGLIPETAFCSKGSPRVIWQVPRLGQPSAEPQLGPNGLFYLASGTKLVVLDDAGKKLLEAAGPGGGKGGRPVFDAFGSIFLPGRAMVQEVKLNGSSGWNFSVYQDNGSSPVQLTSGPGRFLYLPLPSALYAVDTLGHYKWVLLQWDTDDAYRTQAVAGREILACAGNDKAVFVVYGKRNEGYFLVAVGGEGKILWRYWLGDIKEANLVPGTDGRLYLTVNPAKIDRYSKGTVNAFDVNRGSLLWRYPVSYNDLTAPTLSEDGLLYFCAGEKLFAINLSDGSEAWSVSLYKAKYRPAVAEAGRRIYLGTDDNRLLAVNRQGRLDWELELDGKAFRQPVVGPGGYIYVITDNGTLYKIKDEVIDSQ